MSRQMLPTPVNRAVEATKFPFPLPEWLHARDGRNTRELLLEPAKFGLGMVPGKAAPDAATTMVCGFCSTGCGLNIHLKEGAAVNLTPATNYPVNLGMACPKGWEALNVLDSPDRATTPLIRDASGAFQPTDWGTAMRQFTARFKDIQTRHGNHSIAFLSTGQIATEEMAFLGALAKFGMGILHCDSNTRQCMATSHVAYKQAFGFDAPSFTYDDFEQSDLLIFIGANPCIAHPIMWERVMRNPHQPMIVVVDPRLTETAMQATEHFAIAPKSDLDLLYSIAHELIRNDWLDREFIAAHTNGFDDLAPFVADYPPERAAAISGIEVQRIRALARAIHEHRRVSIWWTMGVNQSHQGVRTAQAIINLCLLTGNIGKPGTGPNSITGQCNAMGSRIYGNITGLYAGRDFLNADDRAETAAILNLDPAVIPTENSWPYHKIVEGIRAGQIKGLWVIATNPAHSWIQQNQFNELLGQLEFLVVQDMYSTTETAAHADLLLPAASWGEKEGTLINSERRIGRIKKVVKAPGQALADFAIFQLVAEYWGCGDLFRQWSSPADAFEILKRFSRGRPCDITGIRDYAHLDQRGGIQWPYSEADAAADDIAQEPFSNERRLFADGRFFTSDGRAKFLYEESHPNPTPTSAEYPFILNTGRGTVAQWHTNTRTAKSAVLRKLYPERIYVELHPDDAARLKIKPGEEIELVSPRGALRARTFVTPTVQPGQVFVPLHYETINQLTESVFDPYSAQPSYKTSAIRIQKTP